MFLCTQLHLSKLSILPTSHVPLTLIHAALNQKTGWRVCHIWWHDMYREVTRESVRVSFIIFIVQNVCCLAFLSLEYLLLSLIWWINNFGSFIDTGKNSGHGSVPDGAEETVFPPHTLLRSPNLLCYLGVAVCAGGVAGLLAHSHQV